MDFENGFERGKGNGLMDVSLPAQPLVVIHLISSFCFCSNLSGLQRVFLNNVNGS